MTAPMTMPVPGRAGTWSERAIARTAVATAMLLSRLSPARLRALLTLVAARARPAARHTAAHARTLVVDVSPYCAGWRGCLPRSIAVCLLCRRTGVWPEWSAGVRATPPFAAHAWVVADGALVGEPGDPSAFRAVLRVPAGRAAA